MVNINRSDFITIPFLLPRQALFVCTLFLVLILLLVATKSFAGSIPVGKPEDVGMSSERLQGIDTLVSKHIEEGNVAGVVTLVARHGQIVHFNVQGVMDVESQEKMPDDAIFWLASMSKPVTAVAIMMLMEEDKLSLSDPASRFIPEFDRLNKVAVSHPADNSTDNSKSTLPAYDLVPVTRAITIHDLLTHGSGLLSGGAGNRIAGELGSRAANDTLASYIPKLADVSLDFQPGTQWQYSGLAGFEVLGRIVEVISGQAFDAYLKEHLFDPLGMTDTAFYFSGNKSKRVALMHSHSASDGLQVSPWPLSSVYFSGAGGIASTAEDYLQFAQMMLNGGKLNNTQYLSPRTVDLMISNHTGDMVNGQFGRPEHGMGFGLSVQIVMDPVAAELMVSEGAYGWSGGSGVSFWIEPAEDMVSIFMIQGGAAGELRSGFESAVRQSIIE